MSLHEILEALDSQAAAAAVPGELAAGRAGLGRRPWRNGILLAAALSAAGWGSGYGWRPPAPQVLTAEVSRADLEDVVLASGVLKPLRQVDVGAQASGQLKTLKVEAGDRVSKGQLLAEIDPENSLNDLKASEAQLESRVAQLRGKQASLRQAGRELARQKQMMGEGSTSQKTCWRRKPPIKPRRRSWTICRRRFARIASRSTRIAPRWAIPASARRWTAR